MKRKCKKISITDPDTVREWVTDCVRRHKKRYDFKNMLLSHGISKEEYADAIENNAFATFLPAIEKIITEACQMIRNKKLVLPPVRIREQRDHTTGKIRMIGCESPMQQIFDYIAVHSSMEIFNKRIAVQQCSSVPGRGQVYGMQLLRRYINRDNRAMRYAQKHKYRYTSKCAYVVKLDVKKCFPSARLDVFMRLFKRDCGNPDILWLWEELFKTHKINGYEGFMIGSLISQWAAQYMLSFLYQKAMSVHYKSHGKQYKAVSHMVMFMDDMALFGSNRKQLFRTIKILFDYAKAELGFNLKPNFAIQPLGQIDMMGFVIYRKGTVSIRGRNYIKSRRLKIRYKNRGSLSLRQCKRIISFKGYYKHSDWHRPGMRDVFRYAQRIISAKEKKNGESNVLGAA